MSEDWINIQGLGIKCKLRIRSDGTEPQYKYFSQDWMRDPDTLWPTAFRYGLREGRKQATCTCWWCRLKSLFKR